MTLSCRPQAPSVAFFCPQSKAPSEEYLQQLQLLLTSHTHLQRLAEDIKALEDTWSVLASHRADIAALVQGPRYVRDLRDWVTHGRAAPVAGAMSGILSLPLLVVMQTCQYFQFLELAGLRHADFLASLHRGGGAQGYCGGLLPAFAIACARDEAEVVDLAAKAMRIALAVGAFGELGDDENIPGPTTVVVRLKQAGQGEGIVSRFSGCYISAITDPKTISIVGPVQTLGELVAYARDQGLLVSTMHIRGKVHNPENAELAEDLCQLCDAHNEFQLPPANSLQVPVRSNRDGRLLQDVSLTHEAVLTILASRCEWYTLLTNLAQDLQKTDVESHVLALYGIGDPVPLAPFHQARLKASKVDVYCTLKNSKLAEYTYPDDAVAVTGIACRLPGANSLDELWDLMANGTSTCEKIRPDRIPMDESFRASQDAKWTSKQNFFGNFVEDVGAFDNTFFRHNPKEAAHMDPQQRMLLELAYQAMDSSGYLRSHRREDNDPVGCFIGAGFVEYHDNTNAFPPTAYTATGMIRAFLCGRISYYFGWSGPAEVIDTACSSSLVAVNRAVRAIRTGECKMALSGGINIMSSVHNYMNLAKAGFLSPTGQCKPFDQSADGYCRADGAALVVLKPLKDALASNDHIFGVIAGSATNQGGLSASITVPSSPAQMELYRSILKQARMEPEHVSYVEAHGTGTQAGDPLEVQSLREVFAGADRSTPLHLGSLKGNIGHCEAAAGIAGLVKVLAMLRSSSIPPLANFRSLNPKIPPLAPDKMAIARATEPWEAPWRAACVNSYGAAGSNAALLCGEGPRRLGRATLTTTCTSYPILVSAATRESLNAYCRALKAFLIRQTPKITDLAYTLSERRKRHRFRLTTTATNISGVVKALETASDIFEAPNTAKPVVLVFGGQSKQIVGLDKSIYDDYPRLRHHIDTCNSLLISAGFPAILPAIFDSQPISDVVVLQTGTFAVQYASAKCWIDAGVQVDCTIGHSFGELTALTVSGVFTLEDGLMTVATRASLMASKWGSERGTMLAIHTDKDTVESIVTTVGELEVACYNAPGSLVVVGTESSIAAAEVVLRDDARFKGIRSQRLDVSHGFHSKFTEPLLEGIADMSRRITFRTPNLSIEMCTREPSEAVVPARLVQHTREPVYFADAVRRIEKRLGSCIWLEAGADSPVIPMIKRAVANQEGHAFQPIKFMDAHDLKAVLSGATVGLWREGVEASFWGFTTPHSAALDSIYLPPYQFQRTLAWLPNIDRATEAIKIASTAAAHETTLQAPPIPLRLVAYQQDSSNGGKTKYFTVNIATKRFTTIVSGHAVRRRPLCPASMYMECAVMAAEILLGDVTTKALCFEDVSFEAPLGVDLARNVSISLDESGTNAWIFKLTSMSQANAQGRQTVHGKGSLRMTEQPKLQPYQRLVADRIKELRGKNGAEKLMSKRAYGLFGSVVHYADFLQGISCIIMDGTQAVADIEVSAGHVGAEESSVTSVCDTVALDTFIQVAGLLINSSDCCIPEHVFVATGIDSAILSKLCDFDACKSWTVYAMFSPSSETTAAGDVFVLTKDGSIAMAVLGVRFTRLPIAKLERMLESANNNVSAPISTAPKPSPLLPAPKALPELTSDEDTEFAQSSASSDGEAPETPSEGENDENGLKEIISIYTGAPAAEIASDANMGDLGVDSLAAVELADDLKSRFGKDISSTDLMMYNLQALSGLLLGPKPQKAPLPNGQPLKPTMKPTAPSKQVDNGRRHRVLQILADGCGAQIAAIRDQESLRDLGFDSLSAVELKSELEDAFSIEVDDQEVHLDSTVGEIMKFLGIMDTSSATSISGTSPSAQDHGSTQNGRKTAEPAVLRDPAATLVECEALFSSKAERCGFTNYWTAVAPKQNELLLAYILEAFRTIGADVWRLATGEPMPEVKHLPKHAKVVQRFFDILAKHDIIKKYGNGFVRSSGKCPTDSSGSLLSSFMDEFPAYRCEAALISLTGSKLAGCLIGTDDPVALLFGSSNSQRVLEDFYTNSPMLATLTELLVDMITRVVAGSGSNTVKIVEVGAGFGGTTKRLAAALESISRPVQYTFTDIASTLVRNAVKKLAKYEWMKFHSLNLEHEAPERMKGSFDIAIGTNCVHATKNRAATMSRIRELLNEDGFAVLSEVTQIIDWYDIVYGLLEGWWMSNDADYPLQPPESWMRSFTEAGFTSATYSQGPTAEANSQRLLLASKKLLKIPLRAKPEIEAVVYKEVDGVSIHADIYLPQDSSRRVMPVALLLHGGGHMTLSRKAIRPAQVSFLLANHVIPVSFDYRLCPEINLIDGPITDVRDAYAWCRTELPRIVGRRGVLVDPERVVVVGWSSGGHLAMSTAWTAAEIGLPPPKAVLSFYGPTDFQSGDLDARRAEEYPERRIALDDIIKALPTRPITSYDAIGTTDTTGLGWVRPGDPRSELVLSLFKEGNGLPILLNGLSTESLTTAPSPSLVASISPLAHVRGGTYRVPTYLIHGTRDEIVPFHTAAAFTEALRARGINCGLLRVEGARHIHDLKLRPEMEAWRREVEPGYEFLFRVLGQ